MKKIIQCAAVAIVSLAEAFSVAYASDTKGKWTDVRDWPLIGIHAVLTPEGNVLTWGTDQNGIQGAQFIYDVWDPFKGLGADSHNTLPNTLGVDSFCAAAVVLPDSANVIMPGGDARTQGLKNFGINDVQVFNTETGQLTRAANMASARWYPTTTTLANGDVLVTGGRDMSGASSFTPEVYSASENSWRSLFSAGTYDMDYWYPRQWVASNGSVFGYSSLGKMYYMNTEGDGGMWRVGQLPTNSLGRGSTAAMYRPGKILQVGGGAGTQTDGAVVIDIEDAAFPNVRIVEGPKNPGRIWADSVILPTGDVLLVGGSLWIGDPTVENADDTAFNTFEREPEIWNPASETWTTMAPGNKPRLYHSTALLLRDGRILVAGGGAPGPVDNTNVEVFSPPYLFDGTDNAPRPAISSAPKRANYGDKAKVFHATGNPISRVTLIKTGAVTHSFNMEQRFIELDFTDVSDGVRVNMPTSANIATPGYYLMFLIDNQGTPSEGHIIRLSDSYQNPAATTDSASAEGGQTISVDVLANDLGIGLELEVPNAWSLRGGNVSLLNNQIRYTAPVGFNGEDKVWYSFKDSRGVGSYGELAITVTAGSTTAPPVARWDSVSAGVDTAVVIDVLANDSGTGIFVDVFNEYSAEGGRVVKGADNKLTYTPDSGFSGEDSFWYILKDSADRTYGAKVDISVN